MNRKAQFLSTIQFVNAFKTLFLLAMGITILLYASSTASVDTTITKDFNNRIHIEQLVFSPSCFAYQDFNNGRVDLGIIDYDKFTNNTLEACLTFGVRPPYYLRPAKATINYYDTQKTAQEINTTLWRGAYRSTIRRTFKVYVKNNTELTPAKLTIMINPEVIRGR